MALINCKGCGGKVSPKAESCPNCGHPIKPKKSRQSGSGCGCLTLLVLIIIGYVLFTGISSYDDYTKRASDASENGSPSSAESKRVSDAECKKSIQCWFDRHSSTIEAYCERPIEALAKYQARWTDGWLEPRFTRASWFDKKSGVIRAMGDKVQFQNGFGAWQNQRYYCVIEPLRPKVIDAGVLQ